MSKIVDAVLNNPIELIACLAFLPLFLMYPGITIANLFVLIALVLSYFLFLANKKPLQIFAPFILLLSLLVYFFAAYDSFSYVFVALAIVTSLSLVYSAMRYGIAGKQGGVARRLFVGGLAIMILLPIVFRVSLAVLLRVEKKSLQSTASEFQTKMLRDNDQIAQKVSEMGADPFVIDLLEKKGYADLASYSQNLMVAKDLDYLTITDGNNVAVARAHRLKAVGDDYSNIMVKIKDSVPVKGIYYEDNRAFLAALTPIQKEGQPKLGSMIGGRFVSEEYLRTYLSKEGGIAFCNQLMLLGSSSNSSLLADFISRAKNQSKFDKETAKIYDFRGNKIMLVSSDLPDGAGKLLYFQTITLWPRLFRFNLIFFCVLLLIAFWYVKAKSPSSPESNRFAKLFAHRKMNLNWRNTLLNAAEFLLLVFILALLWQRSSVVYYESGFDYQTISDDIASVKADISPGLQLGLDSYAKTGDTTKVKLLLNNLNETPASVQLLLKFDPVKAKEIDIDYSSGLCDRVHDKTADNVQGLLSFSCDLRNIDSPIVSPQELVSFSFAVLQSGVANYAIDDNYSYVLTSKGKNNIVQKTFPEGENQVVVSK